MAAGSAPAGAARKQEQADAIRTQILKLKDVPWEVLHGDPCGHWSGRRSKATTSRPSCCYLNTPWCIRTNRMQALAARGFRPATQPDKGIKLLNQKYFFPYELKKPEAMLLPG